VALARTPHQSHSVKGNSNIASTRNCEGVSGRLCASSIHCSRAIALSALRDWVRLLRDTCCLLAASAYASVSTSASPSTQLICSLQCKEVRTEPVRLYPGRHHQGRRKKGSSKHCWFVCIFRPQKHQGGGGKASASTTADRYPFQPCRPLLSPLRPRTLTAKNPRAPSCVLCQNRKVKCDRKEPCSGCVKAGVECVPNLPASVRRRRRNMDEGQLATRLRRCEELLMGYDGNANQNNSYPAGQASPATESNESIG
jgi:hypothetical protein